MLAVLAEVLTDGYGEEEHFVQHNNDQKSTDRDNEVPELCIYV